MFDDFKSTSKLIMLRFFALRAESTKSKIFDSPGRFSGYAPFAYRRFLRSFANCGTVSMVSVVHTDAGQATPQAGSRTLEDDGGPSSSGRDDQPPTVMLVIGLLSDFRVYRV